MQTRNLTQQLFRFRPALVLTSSALMLFLAHSAQAQATLSPPSPVVPLFVSEGVVGKDASSPSKSSGKSDKKTSGSAARTPNAAKQRGQTDFSKLFSAEKNRGAQSETPRTPTNEGELKDGIFDRSVFPQPIVDAHDVKPVAREASLPVKAASPTSDSQRVAPSVNGVAFLSDPSLTGPDGIPPSFPDSTILLPAPDADVFLDWPDDSPEDQDEITRDETIPSYRISEEVMPSGPVDLEPALEAVYRTFLEEQPPLLAYHLRRDEFMGVNTPGYMPGWVVSDLLLDRLAALFATRRTISLEYVRPRVLADGRFGVKAWYTYRDRAGNVYRSHLRFVLKPWNDRLILTSLTLE